MTELVFQNAMNGGVAFSAKGRGMWTVDGREATLTDGLRFAAASATAVHPLDWENAQAPASEAADTDYTGAYPAVWAEAGDVC